ncbi:MAG: Sulfate transport system permease protein CysT [Prochlorococcus marinus str. MIT 9215]|nr:MAG: Sulfate transport system permease protein CysT [Prochlorococcus marinus str. MIT 9215]
MSQHVAPSKPAAIQERPRRWQPGRLLLNAMAVVLGILALWPLIGLLGEAFQGFINGSTSLGVDGLQQVKGTLILLIGTALLGGLLGTANGWILANCRFPGRRALQVAQLIPLATPAYLLSAILIDLGSRNAIRIYGMGWGILIMALTTYPYVFLLSSESFTISGRSQLEACRSLGVGPWNSFRRVALPMAMPAIGAGIALMGMEVVNELGAVALLNIPTISAGIVEIWQMTGEPSGAVGLALIALVIVMALVAYEKTLRSRSRTWSEGVAGGQAPAWQLHGWRAICAQLLALSPPLFTLGVPMFWMLSNLDQLARLQATPDWSEDLIQLSLRSFSLAFAAAAITVLASLVFAVAKRWNPAKWMSSLSFISGIGYAIPGAVLAIALFPFGAKPWLFGNIVLLLWGYSTRFLAVSKGGQDAAFERISPNLDEAAMGLGCRWQGVFRRIHLPLLRGPILVGALFVFVDTIKELPLTFVLRPFDFDTLAVRLYQYAADERMAESLLPSMMIIALGLIASLALIPGLNQGNSSQQQIKKQTVSQAASQSP